MSTTLVTRQTAGTGATVKGTPLTNTEVDTNFINLNNATQPAGGTAGQVLSKIDTTDFNSQWIDNYALQLKFSAKNTTGGTLAKGTVVYVSGGAGANPYISAAKADADLTSATTVGLLESTVADNGFGLVVESGTISGVDTSAAVDGDPVWLSGTTAGAMLFGVANKPQAPIHIVYLGTVTRAHAVNGEIQVKVNNGWELDELHDARITGAAQNDFLVRNGSNLWVNQTPAVARVSMDVDQAGTAVAMAIALG